MIKLAISGCQGRMGQRITALAFNDHIFRVTTLLEHPAHPKIDERINGLAISTNADAVKGSDILIEFTNPDATMEHLKSCVKHGVKMVIGTTGLSKEQVKDIQAASKKIPIVLSSNMSVGVNILFKLAQILSATTPPHYKVNIVEAHHIHKKDAPSGTAKTLAEKIEASSSKKVANIDSIREGEIIGDHKVIFESGEDVLTLEHHAKTRDIFAQGSLVAAKFLAGKNKGLFDMQDVLGLT